MDKDERLRKFINLQREKINKIYPIFALVLLSLNFSMLLFSYIEHREFHPYLAVPLICIAVLLLIWFISHIYVMKWEMYRTEARARRLLDPYTIYALAPYEEMWFRHVFIPLMESCYALLPDGKLKTKVGDSLELIKVWIIDGIIPKEHFPEHLKKYYLTDLEGRL